ncbi:MAG: hypothetical protein NW226_11130 [Microscillaceae bacterium]|nr:hypothetical protein [Microscillaceae bacterium]
MKTHLIKVKTDILTLDISNLAGQVFCTSRYEPEYQLSHVIWQGFMMTDAIIEAYEFMGSFASKNGYPVTRSISDLRLTEGSFDESNQWLLEEYMPKMVKHGFKYSAILPPQDLAAKMAIDFLADDADKLYTIKFFEDYEQAYQWIIQQA